MAAGDIPRIEGSTMAKESLGRIYRDGEIVIRQGEKGEYMHVVQEGEVEVFVEKDGQELPLAVRGEGEILGDMAIFNHAPHSATVRARGEARILTVDKRGFLRRVHEDPSIAFRMLQNAAVRVRDLSGKLARYEEHDPNLTDGREPDAKGSDPVLPNAERMEARPSEGASRSAIFRALDPASQNRAALWVRAGLRSAVCVGLAASVLRAMTAFSGHTAALDRATLVVLVLMAAEYALRLYVAPASSAAVPGRAAVARLRYVASPAGLVDLAAFAPMTAAIAIGTWSGTAEPLGILWILKLARYSHNLELLGHVLRDSRKPLMSVLLLFGSILLLAAAAAHVLEGDRQPEAFGSIAHSLWWSVATLTTTGYGDDVPVSAVGRFLAGLVMISGLAVFGLWAGILANGFSQELRRRDFLEAWDLVAGVPFFCDLGAASIAEVARLLRPQKYPNHSTIFWQGQRGTCMYFIVSGHVEVTVDGRTLVYRSGEFFGEVALVTGGRRTGRAVATEPCLLLLLDIADFHDLASRQPELSAAIRSKAAMRLDRSRTNQDHEH
jgi:voltage-gated potassium channel